MNQNEKAPALLAEMQAQPTAEAQAQGGGEVVEPVTGDLSPCPFCGKSNHDRYPCEWLDGSGANVIRCAWCHGAAPMNVWNRRTAPPSAPVGVEDQGVASPGEEPKPPHTPALRWLADREAVATQEWQDGFNVAYSYYAQQPAAVDVAMVVRYKAAMRNSIGKRPDDAIRDALTAALAQPGGSDNDQ